MQLRLPLLLIAMLWTSVHAAEGVWTWVDGNGVRHYADRPVPGAVQVDVKTQPRSEAAAAPAATGPRAAPQPGPPPPPYRLIEIWSPAAEETITNTGGVVPVRVRIDPVLRPRHTLAIYLDGQKIEDLDPATLQAELQNVPRGTHSLVAAVFDDAGKPVQQGQQVVFYVRQESVAQPPVGPTLRPPPRR